MVEHQNGYVYSFQIDPSHLFSTFRQDAYLVRIIPDVESLDLSFRLRVAEAVDFSLTQDDIVDQLDRLAPPDLLELARISCLLEVTISHLVHAIVRVLEES